MSRRAIDLWLLGRMEAAHDSSARDCRGLLSGREQRETWSQIRRRCGAAESGNRAAHVRPVLLFLSLRRARASAYAPLPLARAGPPQRHVNVDKSTA